PKWANPGTGREACPTSTPEAVVRSPNVVPLVRRLEPSRLGHVLLAGRFVEGDAQARLVRHGDVAVVDDGLFDAVHQVAPVGHVHGMILQHQEVLRGRRRVHRGQRPDGRVRAMQRHGNAVRLRHVADLFGFENAAGGQQIRVNDIHRVVPAQHLERLFQVDVLTGEDGEIHRVGDLLQQLRLLPGDHVLEPGEVVLGERLTQPDATVNAQAAEMIAGERNVHAHHVADHTDEIGHHGQAFFGDFGGHEHMFHGQAAVLSLNPLGARDRAGGPGQQVDPQVHFEPGESLFLAVLQALAEDLGIARFRSVAVDAYAVAELAAQHLVNGNVVRLAREVPQGHLHRAHAAALPRVTAELFDLAEHFVDVAGVLVEDP